MENSEQVNHEKATILLVDDERMVLDVGIQMLKKLGYNVLAAGNGNEAVGIFQQNSDDIDVVILDMVMPDLGGGETIHEIRKINPHAKIVLSSGYGRDPQTAEILERCNGFIQKPFSMKELSELILGIMD